MTTLPAFISAPWTTEQDASRTQRPTPWARARRALQHRRYVAAQRRHEQEPTTDAYIDRYGESGIDQKSFAALLGR